MEYNKTQKLNIYDTFIGKLYYKNKYIYDMLNADNEKNIDVIKNNEFKLKYELLFPINKYINVMNTHDIIICDKNLNRLQIMEIINSQMNIKYDIICKYNEKLQNITLINENISDEIKYTSELKMNEIENKMKKYNKYMSLLMRATRISYDDENDEKKSFFYKLFCNFALPFMIIVCNKINEFKQIHNNTSIIFLSRDGYWFYHLYKILYPYDDVHYLYFSRNLVKNNKELLLKKINNICGKKIFFDLHGTGVTFNSLCIENSDYILCFFYKNKIIDTKKFFFNSSTYNTNKLIPIIEDIFSAPHGSAYNYTNDDIILLDPEYDTELFLPYMQCLDLFKTYHNKIKKYIDITKYYTYSNEHIIMNNLFNTKHTYLFNIRKYITHVNLHDNNCKKYPIINVSQNNQDKYFIEKIIMFNLNGVFIHFGDYDNIFYILDKYLNWKCAIAKYSVDIIEELKKYNNCVIYCDVSFDKNNNTINILIKSSYKMLDNIPLHDIQNKLNKENIFNFYENNEKIICNTLSLNIIFDKNISMTFLNFNLTQQYMFCINNMLIMYI
jgi:hypothetical protein